MTYEPKTHRTNPKTDKAFCGRSDVDIIRHGMATCKKCNRLEDAHYQKIIDALKDEETNRAEHQASRKATANQLADEAAEIRRQNQHS